MALDSSPESFRLRPHHLFCLQFLEVEITGRGEEFSRMFSRITKLLRHESEPLITIVDGVDDLCGPCPDRRDDRCASAVGDETEVRKLDAIILKGIGLGVGEVMPADRLRSVVLEKAPIRWCRRCPWREGCSVQSVSSPD